MLSGNMVNERPDVGEQYEVAINATDLKVEEHRRGAVDLLIATRNAHALGMALRRLRGEWNSAAKPSRLSPRKVAELAARLKADDDRERANRERENGELARLEALRDEAKPGTEHHFELLVAIMERRRLYETKALPRPAHKPAESPVVRAQREADRWFDNELKILAAGLKSRADVWRYLPELAHRCGLSEDAAASVLFRWLNPVCPKCHGRKFQLVAGTPALSGKPCPSAERGGCGGTGDAAIPHGQAGRKLANELDQLQFRATQGMVNRLRGRREK